MNFIKIDEIKQCGDEFLFKFDCPFCGNENLNGKPRECQSCDEGFEDYAIDISNHIFHLLSGTKRKRKPLKKKEILHMLKNQEYKCAYCFIMFEYDNYEIEHVIPLACGGSNLIDNLVLSCRDCNALAGSLYFTDFYSKQRYILKRKSQRIKSAN